MAYDDNDDDDDDGHDSTDQASGGDGGGVGPSELVCLVDSMGVPFSPVHQVLLSSEVPIVIILS